MARSPVLPSHPGPEEDLASFRAELF